MSKAKLSARTVFAAGVTTAMMLGSTATSQIGPTSPKQMVEAMIAGEMRARNDSVRFTYLSEERSDRTKGHLWTERMVETEWGTVRYLLAVDGHKLSPEQALAERSRLKEQTSDPESYKRQELEDDDGERSRQMLQVLPRAFLFTILRQTDQELLISYRPDPSYTPQSIEERAMHGMSGTLTVDVKSLRLHQLDGTAPADISLGFGPFATLKAGSRFSTSREPTKDAVWRTSHVTTAIQGKALLLKNIARQQEYVHSSFVRMPAGLSLKQAVDFAER